MKFRSLYAALLLASFLFSGLAWSAPAEVPQTGQEICYDSTGVTHNTIPCPGSGQDGEVQAGVLFPSPRFTDNGDGTVTDNMTGLVWLKDADCFGGMIWADAIDAANTLQSGSCGLSDGSVAGWWRLPNIRELRSLVNFAYKNPSLSNAAGTGQWQEGDPFINVALYSSYDYFTYWSSTTYAASTDYAWGFKFYYGSDDYGDKNDIDYAAFLVWLVREQRID